MQQQSIFVLNARCLRNIQTKFWYLMIYLMIKEV